jgi:lipoate-protein ligase A
MPNSMSWTLIIDGPLDGARNMSIDSALLDEVDNSETSRTIVRFYTWRTPTVSLGRNQKIEKAVDAGYCAANGIDVVHRPTGGRAVLHDDELTYAVISNDAEATTSEFQKRCVWDTTDWACLLFSHPRRASLPRCRTTAIRPVSYRRLVTS